MSVKLSIIVPVYNAEKFIDRCMQSIYAQTFTDYEIILVNDGSKDNSAKICKSYAEKDSRITFIDKENGGAGSARNAGIEIAKGEYLAFPDVDDWFEPSMYEELYSLAKRKDYDMIFSGVNYYADDGKTVKYNYTANCGDREYLAQADCRKNIMDFFPTTTIFDVPWNKFYKRKVAIDNNVRFSNTRRCQDAMFNIDFYNASNSVASIDKAYYNYTENTVAGFSRKFPKNYIDITVIYYTHLRDILSSWGMYDGDIKLHYDTSFVISVYETMGMCFFMDWGFNNLSQKQYIENIMQRQDIIDFIKTACVKEEEKYKAKIILDKKVNKFIKLCKREKFKDKLRSNLFLRKIYCFVKGR